MSRIPGPWLLASGPLDFVLFLIFFFRFFWSFWHQRIYDTTLADITLVDIPIMWRFLWRTSRSKKGRIGYSSRLVGFFKLLLSFLVQGTLQCYCYNQDKLWGRVMKSLPKLKRPFLREMVQKKWKSLVFCQNRSHISLVGTFPVDYHRHCFHYHCSW